jgi:hypothetical protein
MSTCSRWTLAAAVLLAAATPVVAHAQVADFCDATGGPPPTCNRTKNVTATINSVLTLGIMSGDISLKGAALDTALYEKTWTASGGVAVATGFDLSAQAAALQAAAAFDSVVVFGNRGYELTVEAANELFLFVPASNDPADCRDSAPGGICAATGEPTAGKPVGDVYIKPSAGASVIWQQLPTAASPLTLKNTLTGLKFESKIDIASAWFYASDAPGSYTATLKYTVVGQ